MRDRRAIVSEIILTVVAVGQIILAFVLYNTDGSDTLRNIGWGVLMLSAVFGWLPIFTFRRRGGVEGRGYIGTTVLVDSGIYSIVRHPQYLAGILIGIALPLIAQHWLVILPGLVAVIIYYTDTFSEEAKNLAKFGEAYERYMATVPRLNPVVGLVRLVRRKWAA